MIGPRNSSSLLLSLFDYSEFLIESQDSSGWEGAQHVCTSNLLLKTRSALRSDNYPQNFIQSWPEKIKGWRLHQFSELTVFLSDYLNGKLVLHYTQLDTLVIQLMLSIGCHLPTLYYGVHLHLFDDFCMCTRGCF